MYIYIYVYIYIYLQIGLTVVSNRRWTRVPCWPFKVPCSY